MDKWLKLKNQLLNIADMWLIPFDRVTNAFGAILDTPVGIVIYLHIEGALYAKKGVPSWFLAVFDSKIDVCWNLKKVVNSLIH